MVKNARVYSITPKVLALGVLVFSLFLAGCQQVAPATDDFTSKAGVKIEAALPDQIVLFFKLGTKNPDQIKQFKTLNSYFPGDAMGEFVKNFNEGFKSGGKFEELGLDFDRDIKPIVAEDSQLFVVISDLKPEHLEIMAAFTLADIGKFDALIARQKEVQKADYNGNSVLTMTGEDGSKMYMSRVKDTVFVSISEEGLKGALDRMTKGDVASARNATFARAMKDAGANLAVAFVDLKTVSATLQSGMDEASRAEMEQTLRMFGNGEDVLDMLDSEVFAASVENDGLRVAATVYGKEGADLSKFSPADGAYYLAKQIPAKFPLIYFEGSGFTKVYDVLLKSIEAQEETKLNFEEFKKSISEIGLDFENDIVAVMDKGLAAVLEDNGSVIPSIGFYLDASGKPESAQKIAGKINEAMDGLMSQALAESPDVAMIMSKEEVVSEKLWKIKVNFDALLMGAPENIAKKLSGQKIELYFGLVGNDILTIALKPDLETVYGKSGAVSDAAEFKQALGYLKGADKSVSFLSPAMTMSYIDRVVQLAKESGAVAATDLQQYEALKAYVMPMKSLAIGSTGLEGNKIRSEIFLHIGR
ncbi:DUF3352 domain-containing protein [Candidatus Peregrinibacteria bacterium]|nr:DUF3352 domain-containing protein [Candidatus Peregrinibacteria bacterium]